MNKTTSGKAIVLLGLKHSGKSTIAKLLAADMGKKPVDSDEIVAELFQRKFPDELEDAQSGYAATNRHFYKLKGQAAFWEMEAAALRSLSIWEDLIVATGGGMMENSVAMEIVKANGLVIFLNAPEDQLFGRIVRTGIPPFLDKDNPEKSFHELYLKRTRLARTYADIEINNGNLPVETISELVQESLQEYVYGR